MKMPEKIHVINLLYFCIRLDNEKSSYKYLIYLFKMAPRIQILAIFLFVLACIWHRDRSTHSQTVHQPVEPIKLSSTPSTSPYYVTGPLQKVDLPQPSLFQLLTRKKIDNFVFNHYNHYKLQFTFVDLGYSSSLMFNFFSQQYQPYRITQKIGFDLKQKMLDGNLDLDIHKNNFDLTVRQYTDPINDETVTTFNLSVIRKDSNLNANLTHIVHNKQCFTAIRKSNIVSHKCFGGHGSGKVKIDRILIQDGQSRKQSNMLNPSLNLTRVLYDGLRGSGFHWRWVWGEFNGFSKPQFYSRNHTIPIQHGIAINFGHIFDEGQDFAIINGRVTPIQGLKYKFDEKMKLKKNVNITVTATKPKMQANFTVMALEHNIQDMGVLKLDMVKAEGKWAGWIQDPVQGKKYDFYQIIGLIESCDSLF